MVSITRFYFFYIPVASWSLSFLLRETVDVVKESDSSCHIGQEFDAKAMLVDFEPKVKLMDIFAMDPEDFEKLLNKCEVCVIDLNYIPDEKFDAVSKTLGLENEERNVDDEPSAKRVKRENLCEDKQQLDESEDLENMIANGELKIEENQKYDDVSDDDLDWARNIMNCHRCSGP